MNHFLIDDQIAKDDFIDSFNRGDITQKEDKFFYEGKETKFEFSDNEIYGVNRLIYGKDSSNAIVNISFLNDNIHTFYLDGREEVTPFIPYVCAPFSAPGTKRLKGNSHYQYIK